MKTVSNYDDCITIPSKMNNVVIGRTYKFNPKTPIYPKGLTYHEFSEEWRAARWIKGKTIYIAASKDINIVLDKLLSFNIMYSLHNTSGKRKAKLKLF